MRVKKYPTAGRPSTFNQKIADEICFRISNGESVRSVCRDDNMPVLSTIWEWIRANEQFSKQYAKAKEDMIECYASEIIEISDDSTNDFYEKKLKSGEVAVVGDTEMVNRSRLRVDTRKWVCERMMPKKYGVHQDINFDMGENAEQYFKTIADAVIGRDNKDA